MSKRFLDCLNSLPTDRPPFWYLRQAGRYMEEYRKVRAQAGDFLNLCYTPELAAEVTMQPIRRFGMDAAIIFSDILVTPHAMGIDVWFEQGEGPRLSPVRSEKELIGITSKQERFTPVYDAINRVCNQLPKTTAMIGFCGAPWTLACYVVEGKGSKNFELASQLAYQDKAFFDTLIEQLTQAIIQHSIAQIEAGAEAIMLFDSWAGVASVELFERYCVLPTKTIVGAIKAAKPDAKVIGFPRGAGVKIAHYAKETGVDAVHIDQFTPLADIAKEISLPLQGNLDPTALMCDMETLEKQLEENKKTMQGKPYIINLGHGVIQHTPIEHVDRLSKVLRG